MYHLRTRLAVAGSLGLAVVPFACTFVETEIVVVTDGTETDDAASSGSADASTTDGLAVSEVTGAVRKGPMLLGSSVQVAPLAADGAPTGQVYLTETSDDSGTFAVDVLGPAALVQGSGFFFDEIDGQLSTAPIDLQGVVVLPGGPVEVFINVLTHLQADRARAFLGQGHAAEAALARSAQECTNALRIGAGVVPAAPFDQIDMLSDGSLDAAYVLAVSAVLLQAAHDFPEPEIPALQLLLNALSADLADDGELEPEHVALLDAAERRVDADAVLANLADWAEQSGAVWTPPDLHAVIDSDQDLIANAFDNCDLVPNPGQADADADGEGDACEGECPNVLLGAGGLDLPLHQTVGVAPMVDEYAGSCSTPGPERTYVVVAPEDGTYTFQVTAIPLLWQNDVHLYVLEGACGDGVEVACDHSLSGANDGSSGFEMDMLAGEVATVVVDGMVVPSYGVGPRITIARIGECPDADLGMMAPPFTVMGSTTDEDSASGGSCGGLASDDFAYTWVAPASGTYRFSTAGSTYDTLVHVRDGIGCDGPELACNNSVDGLSGLMTYGSAAASLVAGQAVTIVVDGNDTASFKDGSYQLTVTDECPDTDLGSTVPQTRMGSLAEDANQFDPTCTGVATIDEPFLFTAPANGTYRFRTTASSFNSVVYALNGTCGGAELACSHPLFPMPDPDGNLASIQVPLVMGQTITVVVESSTTFPQTGSFTLEVSML